MKNRLQLILVIACVLFSARTQSQTYNVYFGDIHSQTWYSDGNQDINGGSAATNATAYPKPVARAITYARDVANDMDFLGVSDHNHNESLNMTLAYWNAGNAEADSMNQDGVFVGMRGQEWGVISNGGHVLVYGTTKLFGWDTGVYDVYVPKYYYGTLFDSVKKYGGFCYLAHPQSTDYKSTPTATNGIFSSPYNASYDSVISGIAMKNGPALDAVYNESDPASGNYESRFHDMLKLGYHVAPVGNQDNHHTNFGMINQQRTGVLATSLTRANILDALRNRRAYATEDHNLQVRLEVDGAQMGAVITHASPVPIRIKVSDPDNTISSIVLRYGVPASGSAPTTLTSNSGSDSLVVAQPQAISSTYYYYAYITNSSGRHAWSAPIWVTVPTGPIPGAFALSAPSNVAPNQPVSGTLTWDPSQDATQYDVYFDTNNPPTTLVSANQAGTSYNYSGLTNNVTYRWKVIAKNGNGSTVASGAPWSFTTIVASPTSFALTSPANGAIKQAISGSLIWQASPNAATYDVYLDTNPVPSTQVTTGLAGTNYNYSGLLNSKGYYWKIVAKNVADTIVGTGSPSGFSTIGPSPATFSFSSPANNSVDQPVTGSLVWSSSTFATHYDVYLDGNNPPTTRVGANVTDTVWSYSLTPGGSYFWKVVAKNDDDSTIVVDAPHSFIIANVPTAASNISSLNITTASLDLSWTDNASNETGYRVYRSLDAGGPFAPAGPDLASDAVSFTDTGLGVNVRYYYRVVPFNGLGEGAHVSLNVATLAEKPGQPALSNAGFFGVTVTLAPGANPVATQFSIRASHDSLTQYIQADGNPGNAPVWQTYSQWGGGSGVAVLGLHSCKDYTFGVTARNLDDVSTLLSDEALQSLQCFSLAQSVSNGWNLMSLPLTVPDVHKAAVFPTSSSQAFFYNGSYVTRDTITYGEGFWIQYNGPHDLNVQGEPRLLDTMHLRQGWNMIASYANPVPVSALSSQPAGIVSSNYFAFDGAYLIADSLKPMKGYWVKANNPGVLVASSPLQQSGTQAVRHFDEMLARMNSITFKDQAGHHQSVYLHAVKNEVQSSETHALPPLPPSGIFDVRFASQKFAEDIAPELRTEEQRFPITLQGISYPLHISWDIKDQEQHYTLSDGVKSISVQGVGETLFEQPLSRLTLIVGDPAGQAPKEFALHQNYPNPFNPSTVIKYDLPAQAQVRLDVYNVLGTRVATLVDKQENPGFKSVSWNAEGVPSGVYYYRLTVGSFTGSGKMLLVR
ncbi:MAG TPA: CehA/McbA family metallohydrolase [Bacteroidota bacterium]|nr:CehA/McbA family metallohydrolase [Bacteroidota bacterium]